MSLDRSRIYHTVRHLHRTQYISDLSHRSRQTRCLFLTGDMSHECNRRSLSTLRRQQASLRLPTVSTSRRFCCLVAQLAAAEWHSARENLHHCRGDPSPLRSFARYAAVPHLVHLLHLDRHTEHKYPQSSALKPKCLRSIAIVIANIITL